MHNISYDSISTKGVGKIFEQRIYTIVFKLVHKQDGVESFKTVFKFLKIFNNEMQTKNLSIALQQFLL